MIKDIGAAWVILGHSERRHVFGESDEVSDPGMERWSSWDVPAKARGVSGQNMTTRVDLTVTCLVSVPFPVDRAEGGSCSS